MERPQVFVSFAGQDRPLARRIFARLEAQPIDLWNYADEAQEIPGGADIPAFLADRINKSDHFLPLVSRNAFESQYARMEVCHATERRKQSRLQVIPLVVDQCGDPTTWPKPYNLLSGLRHRHVDCTLRTSLEETIVSLCADMHVQYLSLPTMDPRLPFLDRFITEIQQKCPRHDERNNAIYSRLMKVLNEFQAAFEQGDFTLALKRTVFLIMMAEYEFPNEPFYYPYVVKGVCEIACGQLLKATETFNALLNHPRVDESTYSGLGYICQQQGMYREAMEHYRKARTLDASDPTAKAGELTNAILCGEAVDVEQALQGLNLGAIENLEDRAKIRAIRAFALGSVGRLAEAEAEFDALINQGWANASVLVNFATVLVKHKRRQEARDLLMRHCRQFPDRALLHLMASLSFLIGEWDKAQDQFATLVERFPLVRQYRIDAAQVFWHAGNPARAKQLSVPVLDPIVFSPPRTENDFFFDGFANWFLARYERADYDFERSRLPPEKHYDRLMQRRRP